MQLDEDMSVNNKMVLYNQWNRDVAVLCNHQKAKSKTFDASMDKVRDKLNEQKVNSRPPSCVHTKSDVSGMCTGKTSRGNKGQEES